MRVGRRVGAGFIGLVAVLAGCLGAADDKSGETTGVKGGGLETNYLTNSPNGLDKSLGSLIGQVYNYDNITVRNANIVLVETSNFTRADDLGRFGMVGIKPGTYTLHVDAPKYQTLEEPIEIRAGEPTQVLVRLAYLDDESAGFREHRHDLWGPDLTKTLFSGIVEFEGTPLSGGDDPGLIGCSLFDYSSTFTVTSASPMPADETPRLARPSDPECYDAPIRLETGKIVLPGTSRLDFTVTFQESPLVPFVSLRAVNATPMWLPYITKEGYETSAPFHELRLQSGKTYSLFLNDTIAQDNGHAHFTSWSFILHADTGYSDVYWPAPDLVRQQCGPFTVKIEAFKGIVPPERPHHHFWTNGSTISVPEFSHNVRSAYVVADRDPTFYGYDVSIGPHVVLPTNVIVPPGTTRIDLTMTYAGALPLDSYWSKKTLSLRTAKHDPRFADWSHLISPTPSEPPTFGTTKYSFHIDAQNDTDPFYQCKDVPGKSGGFVTLCTSFWLLVLANEGKESESTMVSECNAGCGTALDKQGTTYRFNLSFVNENWDEDFKAGRI